jgi:hypothetical protein
MSTEMFNATVFVSEQLNRLIVNAAQELANRVVTECGSRYNFDSEEAIRLLGLNYIKLERKSTGKTVEKSTPKAKVMVAKPTFPLPYNGEFNDSYCYALRQNNGLYTQCQIARKGDKHFCKSCQALADKNEGTPEYGVIQSRQAVGILEYVDPKGRKPVAYTKVMKKYKLNSEQVLEEAGKFNIIIDANHFIIPEEDTKRGRPASIKAPKEPKGAKGRPKKAKKVLQIEGDDDDLFAALVADANEEDEEMIMAPKSDKKKGKSEEEKEAERIAKETEKSEKLAKLAAEKEEKEAKLAAEKAEKELKKETERLAREAKKAAEEAEKKAKEEQRLKEKADKDAKLASEKESKSKKPSKKAVEDEEPDVVKKIEFEGKKYLKSKKTGIIYDYAEYVKTEEQIVVGQWNETTNKIDFKNTSEESEDEYDD